MRNSGDSERLIVRSDLADRLATALDRGVLVVTADAGFGKTIAVQQALERRASSAAWVSVADSGGDPGRLFLLILDAIERVEPGSVAALRERLAGPAAALTPEDLSQLLLDEIEKVVAGPLTLVLDDAESLADSANAKEFIARLVRGHNKLRIALVSRRQLDVGLARLQVREALTVIGRPDLIFGADDCAHLLRQRFGREPTSEDIEAVLEATEGWPLGVALTMRRFEGPAREVVRRGTLKDFLLEEVLETLPPEICESVIDSSVPAELDEAMVEALGLTSSFLADAQKHGTFLRPVDAKPGAWRYHPLMRELLRERFEATRSCAERQELRVRVARVLQERGDALGAIDHLLDAEAWDEAVTAIGEQGPGLIRTAPATVEAWVGRLPEKLRTTPTVDLLNGTLQWAAGRYDLAVPPLRAAVRGFAAAGQVPLEWVARFALLDPLYWLGRYDEMVELAEGFDEPGVEAAGVLGPASAFYAATALAGQGRFAESDELAERAFATPAGHELTPIDALRRCFIDVPAGNLTQALERVREAIRSLTDYDPFNRRSYLMASEALILSDSGYFDDSAEAWRRAEGGATETGDLSFARDARIFVGLLEMEGGGRADVDADVRALSANGGFGWGAHDVEQARAWSAYLAGDPSGARTAVDHAVSVAQPAPIVERFWTATAAAPLLVLLGETDRAREVLDEAGRVVAEGLPGSRGAFLTARVLLLSAWVAYEAGDRERALRDLSSAWEHAGARRAEVLRWGRQRLLPMLSWALEREALDPAEAVRAMSTAWPAGTQLVPLLEHPHPDVRAAVVGPAAASGDPRAVVALAELERDRDPRVAARAAATRAALRDAPPPLVINTLGRFEVRRGTWTIDSPAWGRPMAAKLFRLLLVQHGEGVHEDLIFEAFWPDSPASAARKSLQVTLTRARAALDLPGTDHSTIEVHDHTYRLALAEQDFLDAEQFDAAARRALAERGARRRERLEAAAALWHGDPLPEDRYEDWAAAWRERMTDRHLEVMTALMEESAAHDDQPAAVRAGRTLLDLDPLNEHAHRELMRAYARSGRRSEALKQYLECRRRLSEDLGVEPARETADVHARILAGEVV